MFRGRVSSCCWTNWAAVDGDTYHSYSSMESDNGLGSVIGKSIDRQELDLSDLTYENMIALEFL